MKKSALVWLLLFAATAGMAGSVPQFITYQGTLKDKGVPATGAHKVVFRLTDDKGNQKSFVEQQVEVHQGLFAVQLDFTKNGTVPIDWQGFKPYISVTIDDQTLNPAEPISATAYSFMSASVVDASITPPKLDSAVQTSLVPAGAVMAYAAATPPKGWLLCDGSAVSRSQYPTLFQAIGATWGVGDGVSTFNLPDLRGRTPLGAGQGPGLTNRTLAEKLGEETHTLTAAEMPSHSHVVNDPGHNHETALAGGGPFGTGPFRTGLTGGTGNGYNQASVLASSVGTGISVISTGGGGSHNNIPPSAAVNFIVKY